MGKRPLFAGADEFVVGRLGGEDQIAQFYESLGSGPPRLRLGSTRAGGACSVQLQRLPHEEFLIGATRGDSRGEDNLRVGERPGGAHSLLGRENIASRSGKARVVL